MRLFKAKPGKPGLWKSRVEYMYKCAVGDGERWGDLQGLTSCMLSVMCLF